MNGAIAIIIDELARRLERDIKLKHVGSWSRAQAEVKSGRVDLIAGAFYTVPRNQWMDYVYPAFLHTNSVVWKSASSDFGFENKTNLVNKVGVTVINNSFGQEFDEYAKNNLKIEQVASLTQAFKMLQLNRVDYALYEKNPGLAYATELGINQQIMPLDPPISSEGLYLTLSHNSKCNTGPMRGLLAKHMREMAADGYNQKALMEGMALWENVSR